jgi:hypothetical protein
MFWMVLPRARLPVSMTSMTWTTVAPTPRTVAAMTWLPGSHRAGPWRQRQGCQRPGWPRRPRAGRGYRSAGCCALTRTANKSRWWPTPAAAARHRAAERRPAAGLRRAARPARGGPRGRRSRGAGRSRGGRADAVLQQRRGRGRPNGVLLRSPRGASASTTGAATSWSTLAPAACCAATPAAPWSCC